MLQKSQIVSIEDFDKGLFTASNILKNERGHSPSCMNVKFNFDGSLQKRLGSTTQNSVALGTVTTGGWILDTDNNLSTSLQAYWKLDEVSGGREDSIGSNDLNDENTVTSSTGIRNNAGLFTAANSEDLYIVSNANLQAAANFSIGGWFYLSTTSLTREQTIVSKRDFVDRYVVLLLHCDGTDGSTTFTDSSYLGLAVTANGNAQIDTAQKKFGTASALFDGSGDYLSLSDNGAWDFGTGDFTVECFVRFSTVGSAQTFFSRNNNQFWVFFDNSPSNLNVRLNGTVYTFTWSPSIDTWYHVAVSRSGTSLRAFIDGSQIGSTESSSQNLNESTTFNIGGKLPDSAIFMNGWIDEVRISKGIARYTSNFTVPTKAFGVYDYEYWLFVNTDNIVTFRVSSSGYSEDATVRATSLGAVAVSSWYRVIAWHSDSTHIGVDVNLSVNTALYTSNVRAGTANFVVGGTTGGTTGWMDGRIDEVGYWTRALSLNNRSNLYGGGTGNTYEAGNSSFTWAMYDFGASSIRWLTIAAGTGIYASSNLGVTFVVAATTRTQTYQYFERSKNVLIATSDAYDPTLYWAGSAGTNFSTLAPNSAPAVRLSINHQGFLILLNSSTRKRGFYYNDESTQLTSAWPDNFDIPSTADDEITAGFVLNRVLYISTKYKIYRLSYLGGNPDWSYQPVATWGFVPRTAKVTTLQGREVVIGLDWDRHIRVFGGTEDTIISDNIEPENGMSDFSISKISYAGSGFVVSHALIDPIEQEYRLCLSIGAGSTQTTHSIVFNLRNLAFYPYSNQQYQCMAIAESAGRTFAMAADRSGYVHILNTGNRDITVAIDEHYSSPFMFNKSPAIVQKSNKIDLYFEKNSSGTLYFQDRADLSSIWSSNPKMINILSSVSTVHIVYSQDVPSTHNIYQFKIMSSSSTANPWKLTHMDFFLQSMGVGKGD